jgi:DNA-binding Lrp family transcriptional regulator
MEFDNVDIKMISALQADGRIKCTHLAQLAGISPSTASKKLNALVESRILNIQAIPNPYKIQYTTAIICMNVSVDKINSICNYLKKFFNVLLVATTFGRFNILTVVYFQSWKSLHDFLSTELPEIKGIYENEIFL